MKKEKSLKFEGGPALFCREFDLRHVRVVMRLKKTDYKIGDAETFSENGGDEFGIFCHANAERIKAALVRMVETCVEP